MAITTVDQLLAGFQPAHMWFKNTGVMEAIGIAHSLLLTPGVPGAGFIPGAVVGGTAVVGSLSGMPPFVNPPVDKKAYLARVALDSAISGKLYLHDRLWHFTGVVVTQTTAQTINSVEFPPRDFNGTSNGEGVLVALECYFATTNGAVLTQPTLQYTNSDGVTGRTGTFSAIAAAVGSNWPATAVAGTLVPFQLQAGDRGVRSIQSLTLGASMVSGTVGIVAYRPLCTVEIPIIHSGQQLDWSQLGLPELYNGTSFWLAFKSLSLLTGGMVWGQIQCAHG